ncbi:hypothetical protein FNU76_13505 [Chitinimonas arctica]|uniref:DUF3617 family protein n=1 Tax=Chitinimonas arctica TaxID=2594795 RepID=A0A516SGZ9_9NEIS|nr:hypothetical protein [Chitinimonas arctica]QDQ27298.1 hypothetical protein FNU76_13505 [Chitinimonas arctica]
MKRGFYCSLLTVVASTTASAGADERMVYELTTPFILKPLNLHLKEYAAPTQPAPATAVSPILRITVQPMASGKPLQDLHVPAEELAAEQMIRSMEQQAWQASANSGVCLNPEGNESSGGGINWSLQDGFGFYVQGKGFKPLQKLMKRTDVCRPGDPSPMCKTMPKQICN